MFWWWVVRLYEKFGFVAKVMVSPSTQYFFGFSEIRSVYMEPQMHVAFVVFQFSIWISGCIVKEVVDAVANVFPLTCRNMCGNISNCIFNGRFDGVDI